MADMPTIHVPDKQAIAFPFPSEVLAQLKPGDQITWGFEPPRGEGAYAQVTLLEDPGRVEQTLRLCDQSQGTRCTLCRAVARAEVYGVAGMHLAALREMEPFLATETVSSRQAIVRGMLDQSLQGLKLESSRQAVQNLRRIAGLDDSVKRIFFPH